MSENGTKGKSSTLGPPWWTNFNYQLLHQITSRDNVDGAVFGWRSDLQKPAVAPQIVLAFRGTMKNNTSDYVVDLKIYGQYVDSTDRLSTANEAVQKAAEFYGIQSIIITGHSLCAALGLVSASLMATKGKYIETHLFNPPFSSSGAPFQSFLLPHSYDRLSLVYSTVKAGLVNAIKSNESKLKSETEFHMLGAWYPHLYVHSRDPISSGYADYFRNHFYLHNKLGSRHMPHETIRGLFKGSIPHHLIPSAIMHVCDHLGPNEGFSNAHTLNQWWNPELPLASAQITIALSLQVK